MRNSIGPRIGQRVVGRLEEVQKLGRKTNIDGKIRESNTWKCSKTGLGNAEENVNKPTTVWTQSIVSISIARALEQMEWSRVYKTPTVRTGVLLEPGQGAAANGTVGLRRLLLKRPTKAY